MRDRALDLDRPALAARTSVPDRRLATWDRRLRPRGRRCRTGRPRDLGRPRTPGPARRDRAGGRRLARRVEPARLEPYRAGLLRCLRRFGARLPGVRALRDLWDEPLDG